MFTVVPGLTTLYLVSQDGTLRTLTLPAGVTLAAARSRFAVLGNLVVIAGGPSEALWIDALGSVRTLPLQKPVAAPTLADGGAGAYTGTRRAKVSFLVKDDDGNVLAESPLSEASAALRVVSKTITYTLAVSSNPIVNARRVYVTADAGTEYFAAFDLDDNTTTSYSDDSSDEAIDVISAPTDLACAPARVDNVVEYRGRVVARSAADPDAIYISAPGKVYAYPTRIPIGPQGGDTFGVTGFMSRRDELGVCRWNSVWKLIGSDEDSFEPVRLIDGKGGRSPDACIVVRDIGYFLSTDGVYSWGPDGVKSISDENVQPWFNTDDYFNRTQFPSAFMGYDPRKHAILLFLCAAGSTTIDRWVEYEIGSGRWMGPHKVGAFTPSAAGAGFDANGNPILVVAGTDGYLYTPVVGGTASDGTTTAIEVDALMNPLAGDPPNPDDFHVWLQASVFTKKQVSGSMSLIPYVGDLDAVAGATIAIDLTSERNRTRHIGAGRLLQLRWLKTAAGVAIDGIYGIKIPVIRTGRR